MSEQGFSVRLSARIDGYLAAMEAAKKATKETAAAGGVDFERLGGKMQSVGQTMSTHVTLPIVAAGGLAIKMSSDFESSFQRMQGLAGVEADEVDGLKKSVLDLAGSTAKAPQELADALYEASSAGLDTAQSMDAVSVAAKASAVGMGSARDIVGLVASATAAYGSANITAARATDILTAAIREGRADPTELAGTLGRVLPIANQLGVSFQEVGGATAYLSNVFGDTNRTVTALQGFLIKLVSPTAQGRKALEEMGTSVAELKAAIDKDGLLGALDLLKRHGFQDNAQAMAQLFDDIEGRQGALALMADESGNLANVMSKVADSTGSLDEAFQGVTNTSGFKMKQAWAELQVALIQAGDVIMPIVTSIAGGAAKLTEAFVGLPGPAKAIVLAFLAIVAAAGPVLYVAGSMIKNFREVSAAMSKMGVSGGAAVGAMGVVLVAAAAAAYGLKQHFDNIAATQAFNKEHVDGFTKAILAGTTAADDLYAALGNVVDVRILNNNIDLQPLLAHMGISAHEFFETVKGGAPAIDAWANAEQRAGIDGDQLAIVTQAMTQQAGFYADAVTNAAIQTKVHGTALEGERHGLDATKTSLDIAGIAAAGLASSTADLTTTEEDAKAVADANAQATKDMARALNDSTTAFEVAASAAGLFRKALDAVFNPAQSLEDTEQALLVAIDATTRAFHENGKTLDINTEKGRANRDAIQAQANAALAHGVAMIGMGQSTAEASGFINDQIAALVGQMTAAHLSQQQIADYIATLGLTPENVDTAIRLADTEATKLRIKDLQDRLGDIDAGAAAAITADIDQGKFDAAEAKLKWIARVREVTLNFVPGSGLRLIYGEGQTPLIRWGYAAAGTFVPGRVGGTPFITGEAGDEAIMPLTNRDRLTALLSDPRIGQPISAAMMGLYGQSGGQTSAGPVVNNSTTVNNNGREFTIDDMNKVLVMARLAA